MEYMDQAYEYRCMDSTTQIEKDYFLSNDTFTLNWKKAKTTLYNPTHDYDNNCD